MIVQYKTNTKTKIVSFFLNRLAITNVYNNEGGNEYRKGKYVNAIDFYTEGISVGCQDKNLNAILFTNRATVQLQLRKNFLFLLILYFPSVKVFFNF